MSYPAFLSDFGITQQQFEDVADQMNLPLEHFWHITKQDLEEFNNYHVSRMTGIGEVEFNPWLMDVEDFHEVLHVAIGQHVVSPLLPDLEIEYDPEEHSE